MKKTLLSAFAALLLGVFALPQQAAAQKYQGQVNITAAGSFSLTGLVLSAFTDAVGKGTNVNTRSTPGLNGMVDVGLTDHFSLGAAYYYQNFHGEFSSYTDTAGYVHNGDYYFGVTRQNIGLRALFHFGDNDDLDTYFGARVGYTIWSYRTNAVASGLNKDSARSRLWPQALFGVRYYFTPNIGVNAELAVGPPYYLSLGFNFRFGGGM